MPKIRAAMAVSMALLASTCGGGPRDVAPLTQTERGALTIRIENLAFNEVTVYARTGGSRIRVGRVAGKGSDTFTIPWPTPKDLQLEMDLLAGRSYTTRRFNMNPGERLELVVQTPLSRSIIRR